MRACARRLLSVVGAFALGTGWAASGVGGSPAAYASDMIACNSIGTAPDATATGTPMQGRLPDDPFASLRIKEAQDALRSRITPGEGVSVAVLDSGIQASRIAARVVPLTKVTGIAAGVYFHGTTVAGLIAGEPAPGALGGIAPGVRLLDLPVAKVPPNGETAALQWTAVARALSYLSRQRSGEHLIVNMSLETSTDRPAIRAAVQRLIGRGAIVVAAGGNRTSEDSTASPSASPYVGTEDHNRDVFPADYPGVVAVGASSTPGGSDTAGDPDPTGAVYANSAIDVAAPTEGARSWTLNGKPCIITDVATSWSTAIVSGVLALLWSEYPDDTNAALVDRLERTASGRDDERGLFTGAGVVQPYDAVTRPLGPAASPSPTTVPQARVAPPPADVLKGTRQDALWWGLLGGGALILALILRPLLSRRR